MAITHTTGQVADALGVSEKAVRLYADRGLVPVDRDPASGRRLFSTAALDRARTVGLLRRVGLSLSAIGQVLSASDQIATFDDLWGEQRERLRAATEAGERARAALPRPAPQGVTTHRRAVPELLTLDLDRRADLGELPGAITSGTAELFDLLRRTGTGLAGHPFVVYHERATGSGPARITIRVPLDGLVRPEGDTRLAVDPAHQEVFLALDQEQVADQAFLVRVHDHLSSGTGLDGAAPAGANREIYLPTFGTGAPGPVMEVAVPVADPENLSGPGARGSGPARPGRAPRR